MLAKNFGFLFFSTTFAGRQSNKKKCLDKKATQNLTVQKGCNTSTCIVKKKPHKLAHSGPYDSRAHLARLHMHFAQNSSVFSSISKWVLKMKRKEKKPP